MIKDIPTLKILMVLILLQAPLKKTIKLLIDKVWFVATPLGYDGEIVVGDLLLVHHNVFKFYNDMKGRQKSGKSFF